MAVAACARAPVVEAPTKGPSATVRVLQVEPAEARAVDSTRLGLQVLVGPESEAAVLRDRRKLTLGQGLRRVVVHGIPSDVEGTQISVRTLTQGARLELVEVRPFSGSVSPRALLEPFLGKEIIAYVWDEATQKETRRPAILLGFGSEGPVVSLDGQSRVLGYGRVAVAQLPDGLRAEPTMELVVWSDREVQEVELSYGSRLVKAGMQYQLVRSPGATTAQITGLVALANTAGSPLVDAAFAVSSETTEPAQFAALFGPGRPSAGAEATGQAGAAGAPTSLVRLPTPVTVAAGQRVIVRSFGPTEAALTRKVVLEGAGLPTDGDPGEFGNASARAVLDATLPDGSLLSKDGMIPGATHLFERAGNEPARGYGSAAARPLPGAKGLRVDLASEDKYPTKRRLLAKKNLGRCVVETTWDVSVSNPTEEPLPIEDVEPISGRYELIESSLPAIAREPDHFAFAFMVPASGESRVKFRVRTMSCNPVRRRYWQGNMGKSWGGKPWSGS